MHEPTGHVPKALDKRGAQPIEPIEFWMQLPKNKKIRIIFFVFDTITPV